MLPRPAAVAVADVEHVADDILQLDHAPAVERRDRIREPTRPVRLARHRPSVARSGHGEVSNLRFGPKATELLRRRAMTRWARSGHSVMMHNECGARTLSPPTMSSSLTRKRPEWLILHWHPGRDGCTVEGLAVDLECASEQSSAFAHAGNSKGSSDAILRWIEAYAIVSYRELQSAIQGTQSNPHAAS